MNWLGNTRRRRRRVKPTSGNIPYIKQWLYIYWNLPYFWTVKIGVTGSYWKRLLDVNKDNAGIDIPIFGAKCYFAFDIEQGNKDFCNKLRVHYFRGTGKTERFLILAAIPAIIMSIMSMAIEWSLKIGAIVGIIYLIKNLPDG